MRLSIPVREGAHEAGAGRILQRLGEARARALATPTGARVSASRTPWSITYTVVGPTTDVDYLAFLLRRAVDRPGGDRTAFRQIRSELASTARARSETPGGRILAELRERVAPGAPPIGGTLATLERLTRGDIRSLWARTHQSHRMRLVVSGSVPLEVLLVSFQEMGAPGSPAPDPVERPAPSAGRPRTQVLRRWYGEARATPAIRDPRAEVGTLLVAETLRRAGDPFESEVQLLELHDRKILAVLGAAYARNRSAMRRRVSTALDETLAGLSAAEVERVGQALRADLLTRARTPEGRVELVGRHLDATGDPGGAVEYMEALARVSPSSLEAFLRELAAREPATAEVRP
jgi:predicted Zn-dependent peptidase